MATSRTLPFEQLPGLGEWDGPIHGEMGALAVEDDGTPARCHACGRWLKAISHHARRAHLLSPAEYRATFGLNAGTPLDAPALRDVKRRNGAAVLERHRPLTREKALALTSEDHRAIAIGKRRRLEARLNADNQELWARFQAAGAARSRELWRDPEHAAARTRRMSEARGGRVTVPCAVCGAALELSGSQLRKGRRHACAGACLRELRRRLLGERGHLDAADVRARTGQTRRATLADRPECGHEVEAKISAARRRREGALTERLRTLDAAAWDGLPEPDRSIVRRYHGLVGEQPATVAELVAAYRIGHRSLRRLLTQGIARLLAPDGAPPAAAPRDERHADGRRWRRPCASSSRGAPARLPRLYREVVDRFHGLLSSRDNEFGDAAALGELGVSHAVDGLVSAPETRPAGPTAEALRQPGGSPSTSAPTA